MKRLTLLFILLGCFTLQAQTKTQAVLQDWTLLAQNTVVKTTNEIDVSGMFSLALYIQHAITTSGTAQDDGVFIVQSASTPGSLNEDWAEMFRIPMITGTPNSEALVDTEPAGETLMNNLVSTTGQYTNDGSRWMFILDNTIASSEMIYVIDASANQSITLLDGIANEHTSADVIFDFAHSGAYFVDVYQKDRIRVIIDNSLDNGGTTVHFRISYEGTTAN